MRATGRRTVEIPLRQKYTARKVVKQVSSKSGGTTASGARQRHSYLPPAKAPGTAPPRPPVLVMDGGSGKRRWARA